MKIVRTSEDDLDIIGLVNEASGNSLLTNKKPFCAVVICKYHGFKKDYFSSKREAIIWIQNENSYNKVRYSNAGCMINNCFYDIQVTSLGEVTEEDIKDLANILNKAYPEKPIQQITLNITMFDLLRKHKTGIISTQFTDAVGTVTEQTIG